MSSLLKILLPQILNRAFAKISTLILLKVVLIIVLIARRDQAVQSLASLDQINRTLLKILIVLIVAHHHQIDRMVFLLWS